MNLRMTRFSEDRVIPDIDPRIRRLGSIGDIIIYVVDGGKVRDEIDVEFALGGNPGRYRYIPLGEVWIEETCDGDDMLFTARHEVYEYALMVSGWTYNAAHAEASRDERKARGR